MKKSQESGNLNRGLKSLKLLKITEKELEQFDPYFEESEQVDIISIAPEVVNGDFDVKVGEKSIENFDAVYAEIPVKNAVFGRVMLEMIEEAQIPVNYSSTGFFTSAKKNYLYYTLHDMDLPAPKTAVVATEKASRNLDKELKGPIIGRRFEDLKEVENKKIDTVDGIQAFADGTEYSDELLIFNEYNSGDKYRCLVVNDSVITVQDSSDTWRFTDENLKYSNISDKQKEIVLEAVKKIGTPMTEVLIRGEEIYDIRPNPDLQTYTDVAGKNAFESVSEMLKEEVSK